MEERIFNTNLFIRGDIVAEKGGSLFATGGICFCFTEKEFEEKQAIGGTYIIGDLDLTDTSCRVNGNVYIKGGMENFKGRITASKATN